MRHLKLTVAYLGAKFCGWQVQKNGLSIQEVMETAWTKITQETIRITASGRTDAGVHALAQVCSLSTDSKLELEILRRALNAHTPFEIEVIQVEEAEAGFHAIRCAVEKTYRYLINWGQPRDVFQMDRAWYVPQRLNVEAMIEAAKYLVGEHDFTSFAATKSETKTSIRTISRLEVSAIDSGLFHNIQVEVTANGFLYNMVRNIVGSLVEVGHGLREPEWFTEVLAGKDRKLAGMTAPACGLYLVNVVY